MDFDPQAIRAFEHASWQRVAARYGDTFAAATTRFVDALLDAAGVAERTRVIDVCCGPGYVASAAAARGAIATGVDFSPAMLGIARAAHPQLDFVDGDAEALPFGDGLFDAAVSNFGIHHAPHPAVALGEMRRVLAPGGRVAFTTWPRPDLNIPWQLLFDAIRRHGDLSAAKAPPPSGSINSEDACRAALAAAGFGDIAVGPVRQSWSVKSARHLVEALHAGTARTAALISAQDPAALPAIEEDIAAHAATYRRGDHLSLPLAAIVARGRK
jgi:SAM-dependent methyltransferase